MATTISNLPLKSSPGDNDNIPLDDVTDGNGKRVTFADIRRGAGSYAINSVSDLQGLSPESSVDGIRFTMLGFSAEGDGGGGEPYWDASEDKQNHDGIMIFSPTWNNGIFGDAEDPNWFAPDTNDTGTGCWKRPNVGYVNARWGGAKTDVEVPGFNSTYAIQAGIDWLVSVPGSGYILIPSADGNYLFEQIDLKGQNIGIVGEGKNGSILRVISTATASNAILHKEAKQFMRDLQIHGNRDNVTGMDCIDGLGSGFNGFGVFQNIEINQFDGTGMKFQNSHMTSLIDVSIGRVKTGLYLERCKPLIFHGLDVGKWTEKAIHFEGTPSGQEIFGQGLFIEATVDTPVAGAQAIYLNGFNGNVGDAVSIEGLFMNGHNTSLGYDIVGIEINDPQFADNISISGHMREVATPFNFVGVAPLEIGNVDFKHITTDAESGAITRYLGVDSYEKLDFNAVSDEIDLSTSGTDDVVGFAEIGSMRIKRLDLRVISATGAGPDTIDISIEGSVMVGTVDVPASAGVTTIVDVTDQLTNLNFNSRAESRIVARASGGGTGVVQLIVYGTKFA